MIARLTKERDEARSFLALAERQFPISATNAVTANAPVVSNGKRGFTSYRVNFIVFSILQFLQSFFKIELVANFIKVSNPINIRVESVQKLRFYTLFI